MTPRQTTQKNLASMVNRKMPRRTQHDLLVEDSDAFLARFVGANRRTNPNERRRTIRKRRLKKELGRIVRSPVFFEEARFGHVWKEHRAWTLESIELDHSIRVKSEMWSLAA